MTNTSTFIPQEIAYYLAGKGWKRVAVKTQSALDKQIAKLEALGAEIVETRDL